MIDHLETPNILSVMVTIQDQGRPSDIFGGLPPDTRTAPISQSFKASSEPAMHEPITYTTAAQWGCLGRGVAVFGIGGAERGVTTAVLKRCHPFPVRPLEHNLLEAARKFPSAASTVDIFDQGEDELVSDGFCLKLGLDVRPERREAPFIMELVAPLYTLPMAKYISPFMDILDCTYGSVFPFLTDV